MVGAEIGASTYVSASLVKKDKKGRLSTETYNLAVGQETISQEDVAAALRKQAEIAKSMKDFEGEERLKTIAQQIEQGDFGEDVLG